MTQKSPGKSWNLILQFLWQPWEAETRLMLHYLLVNEQFLLVVTADEGYSITLLIISDEFILKS